VAWNGKGKVNSARAVPGEMDAVIPWPRLVRLSSSRLPPKPAKVANRWDWRNAADLLPAAVVQPVGPAGGRRDHDSESMRRFVRVELGDEVVPDETTILRFRHLLEQHGLTQAIFNSITGLLEERRLLLRSGTNRRRDHSFAAPSSTKNASATPRPGD